MEFEDKPDKSCNLRANIYPEANFPSVFHWTIIFENELVFLKTEPYFWGKKSLSGFHRGCPLRTTSKQTVSEDIASNST